MNIRSFSIPRNYIFGWNSLSEISKFVLKKPLIVTDKKVMTDTGHLTKLLDELEHEYDSILILDISKEPSFADLKETWIKCKEYSPDSIIALGGGAVIDIAKALNYLMNNQSTSIEQFINDGIPFESTVRINDKSSNLIAIPTTSGTGSEVTCAAVYSHPATRTKKLYLSSQLIPDTAILDPELTVTLPAKVTAQSGFDALTHAIESFICTIATPYSRAMSLEAISIILSNLKNAYQNGNDRSAREAMMYGSSLAGIAISNSCTGLAHSLDQIGSIYKIPHGAAMAPLFMNVLDVIQEKTSQSLTGIIQYINIEGKNNEIKTANFINQIKQLIKDLDLPTSYSSLDIPQDTYEKSAKEIIPGALEAFATKVFPIEVNAEMLSKILKQSY